MTKNSNVWSLVCRRLIVDEKSKLMSAVDIMDRFVVNIEMAKAPVEIQDALDEGKELEKPIQVPGDVTVASYWFIALGSREKNLVLKTSVLNHKGKSLADGSMEFTVPKDQNFHRTFVRLPSFPVTGSGMYTVVSKIEDGEGKVLVEKTLPVPVELRTV